MIGDRAQDPDPGSFPSFASLAHAFELLAAGGVSAVLGGSALLASLGLVRGARDWDITTDAPLERVLEAVRGEPFDLLGPNGVHADHKLQLESGVIEIIVGFALKSENGVVRMPSLLQGSWKGVPVGSPEVWAVAYRMMGRRGKSDLLFEWMRRHGARREAIVRLKEEPLPLDLMWELEDLKTSSSP